MLSHLIATSFLVLKNRLNTTRGMSRGTSVTFLIQNFLFGIMLSSSLRNNCDLSTLGDLKIVPAILGSI